MKTIATKTVDGSPITIPPTFGPSFSATHIEKAQNKPPAINDKAIFSKNKSNLGYNSL